MAKRKLWKFLQNIQDLNWTQGVEGTKTAAEAAKAVFDLAKVIKEQRLNIQNFKLYGEQISSLLDVFNSPLGQITKEAIPFAPVVTNILKIIVDATNKELSLEECMLIVSQLAYIKSFQDILEKDAEFASKINQDRRVNGFDSLASQIRDLGDQEFDDREVKRAIVCFHDSQLAEAFNRILEKRLQHTQLTDREAKTLTERVARHTDEFMQDALVEVGEKANKLWRWYSAGGTEKLEKNLNIEDYLERVIKGKPEETIFDEENITFRDLYVSLEVKELDAQNNVNLDLEEWVKGMLHHQDSNHKKVLFIEGEAGRGKSVFCRMFADWVRRELHPSFTPILIRLRDLRVLENNLTATLKNYLQNLDFVTSDSGWLTDKNTRFLFLLDGFDELLLEGRPSGGLREFLEQVEQFQRDPFCHHQFLVTGRPLALQGIERLLSQTGSLKRVELQPMSDSIQQQWLEKWAVAAKVDKSEFEKFLEACPHEVKNKLAREPLLLYLLTRMHRDQRLNVQMFAGAEGIKAKVRIYDESVKWVLEKQRENSCRIGLENEDLRQFLTEAALCVVQSGHLSAKVAMLAARLKDSKNPAANLIQDARQENTSEKNQQDKLLTNLLTAFYIKPASGDKGGSVEFVHKSFSEFLFAELLVESFVDWTMKVSKKRQREEDLVTTLTMDRQIYDLLGYGNLTLEIVEYLMGLLAESPEFKEVERFCNLFQRLENFYFRWCDGEFIDAEDANLPQIKKRQLKEQLPERESHLGLREVDVYTGLNVIILLLELHRYAQTRDNLRDIIAFHPCGKPNTEQFDSKRLLHIIGYSHCLSVSAFNNNLKLFLSSTNLSGANLSSTNLSGVNLSGVNLSCAILFGADLSRADLRGTNLSGANLRRAHLEGVVWNDETTWPNANYLRDVSGLSSPLEGKPVFAAAVALTQAISLGREGRIEEALAAFTRALDSDPSLNDSADYCNSICWVSSIHGHTEDVLRWCERAVTLDPEYKGYQDSRGLAKVLTGDLVGALEDFQAAVDSNVFDYSKDVKQRRLRWIETLKSGNNPLTPEELKQLRRDEG